MAGSLLIAQSGGPSAVVNASLAGLIGASVEAGVFKKVLGLRHGILGALPGGHGHLDLSAFDTGRLVALADTPGAALGSCRHKLDRGERAAVINWFRHHDIHFFAYIGGNDSMQTCLQLDQAARDSGYELSVVGVPKTIDNDLLETDHCPGYGSAARFWATTAQEVSLDLAAMRGYDTVAVLECMGRNSGWLAAAATLGRSTAGGPPHIVLIPEVQVELDKLLARVEAEIRRNGSAVVVTAETVRACTGGYLAASGPEGQNGRRDAFGHPIVAGTADFLANHMGSALGVKARTVKPGTMQRAASRLVSSVDRDEAWQVGAAAARMLAEGKSGVMVTLQSEREPKYRSWCEAVSLERVAGGEKTLPASFLEVYEGGSCNFSSAFADYARPLLGGPLPEFVRLS
ncbi:MAG: 6-phosphofructokinase [Dehalococcoidia bacterium]|nr:6-phosphofructokinase [Dehalococcoidia bacterium]